MGAVGGKTPAHRSHEIDEPPAADAGCFIRRDVGADDGAELGEEDAAPSVGEASMLAVGVTFTAASRGGEIGATRRGTVIGAESSPGNSEQEKRRYQRRDYLISTRKFWWQAPQPFFPRSANAVWIAALSPVFTAS